MALALVVFSLMLVLSSSTQLLHYVQPKDLPSADCPGQPCLTLDQYMLDTGEYFTTGVTFILLDGQHTLQETINLTSISDVTLTNQEDCPQVSLACMSEGGFVFENVSNVTIKGLVFMSQSDRRQNPSLLTFVSSREIRLLNVTFQGNQQFRAIYCNQSIVTIERCHFEDNFRDNGGALYVEQTNIILNRNTFIKNKARRGGAIFALNSSLYIYITFEENSAEHSNISHSTQITNETDNPLVATVFLDNKAELTGGAMYLDSSTLSISGTVVIFANNTAVQGGVLWCKYSEIYSTTKYLHFLNNRADTGGAILLNASSLYIGRRAPNFLTHMDCGNLVKEAKIITTIFSHNLAKHGGAVVLLNSTASLSGTSTIFYRNSADQLGGAVFLHNSTASLSGTRIVFDRNSADQGGALLLQLSSTVVSNIEHLNISNNMASSIGGAITSRNSSLSLGDTNGTNYYFINNSCGRAGGAIFHYGGLLVISGNSHFTENHAIFHGGAIFNWRNHFHLSHKVFFIHNSAQQGGALFLFLSHAVFSGKLVEFRNNLAENEDRVCHDVHENTCHGGAITSMHSSQIIAQTEELNFIENFAGGAGGAITANRGSKLTITSASFIRNRAEFGGAILIESQSNMTINGTTRFSQNSGRRGGAIYASASSISTIGHTNFLSNKANDAGGAIFVFNAARFTFSGLTAFDSNEAEGNGGAIYAVVSGSIEFSDTIQFIANSALNGGAMFFESGAILTIEEGTNLTTSYNNASEYGGAIYHVDSATTRQCEYNRARKDLPINFFLSINYCFMILKGISLSFSRDNGLYISLNIESYYDSAGKDGSYIYGGLMDKCQMSISHDTGMRSILLIIPLKSTLKITPSHKENMGISSKPYQLCFCQNSSYVDCFSNYTVEAYRGQRFSVFLRATAQSDAHITSSIRVTVKLNPTARLNLNQSSQVIENCSATTYNVYSTEDNEELVVYAADGPCIDRGLARAVIKVTLLPCPDGFTQSREQCVCEERLQAYDADCTIDERIVITKKSINFWMSALYMNGSYQGLVLYEVCPTEYCKTGNVSMTLDNLDVQCNFNHTGILCGACATNYSLLLGSSTCQICSNKYLFLLVPFALAGLGLVIFLTFLRLTVATGLINSLILYANIVQANKSLFFPPNTRNLLTVFIAWLNLDLGFETCFYDGMDGYAQTWLQFAFPLYVWMLISLIIISSRYSIKVSRLIGSNPIAVLATLLLLSYTKILKIVIEVFSFVKLDYPDDKHIPKPLWLKDGNVPYMVNKHLVLTIATLCIMIFFFLPYTLLLLVGYKLYSFQCCRKYFHSWLMRFRSLLDSYYAPYNIRHQYWTGFMLLVRCALYIVFSYNSLGKTDRSLLAITIAFVPIGLFVGSMRIYKKMFINFVEVGIYFNLFILSTVTLADIHSPALVHLSVGFTFVTFMSVCVYHLYTSHISQRCQNLRLECLRTSAVTDQPLKVIARTIPTETVIEAIREPLLEN